MLLTRWNSWLSGSSQTVVLLQLICLLPVWDVLPELFWKVPQLSHHIQSNKDEAHWCRGGRAVFFMTNVVWCHWIVRASCCGSLATWWDHYVSFMLLFWTELRATFECWKDEKSKSDPSEEMQQRQNNESSQMGASSFTGKRHCVSLSLFVSTLPPSSGLIQDHIKR